MPLALAIVCGIVVGSCKVGNFSPDHHRRLPAGRSGLWALWPDRSGQPDAQGHHPSRPCGNWVWSFSSLAPEWRAAPRFAEFFHPIYFVYGILMTALPMVVGYLFAKHVLKLSLLNNLGSITGGMTSTPRPGDPDFRGQNGAGRRRLRRHLSHRAALGGGHLPSHYPCAVIALQGFQTQTESR